MIYYTHIYKHDYLHYVDIIDPLNTMNTMDIIKKYLYDVGTTKILSEIDMQKIKRDYTDESTNCYIPLQHTWSVYYCLKPQTLYKRLFNVK